MSKISSARPRILITDDDARLGAAIGERLIGAGYDVSIVTSGYEAMAESDRFRPDLMIIDINLIGSNGLTVVQRIRDFQPYLIIPAILISAQSNAWYREFGPPLAVSAYLQKPIDLAELVRRVHQAISREFEGVE